LIAKQDYQIVERAKALAASENGRLGARTEREVAGALQRIARAAEQGDPRAHAIIGWAYATGLGLPKDPVKAQRSFEQSALGGDPDGQREAAIGYLYGRGRRIDQTQGFKWLTMAARNGDNWARFRLGWALIEGEGVRKNRRRGAALLQIAARSGLPDGELYLAYYYDFGLKKRRPGLAARWYERAACHGKSEAMFNLGRAYIIGNGVPRDESKALLWFQRAFAAGDNDAREQLDLLRPRPVV
jgi:TPR repeat protein